MEIVYDLLIGAVAGWIAGQLMKGRGFGVLGNIVVGVLGAMIGGYLFRSMGVAPEGGLLGGLAVSVVGAVVLLVVVGVLKKA